MPLTRTLLRPPRQDFEDDRPPKMRDLSNLHRAIERVENMLGGAGGGGAASGSEASSKQKLTEALSEYGWEAADCLAITDDIIANGFTARLTGVFKKNGFSDEVSTAMASSTADVVFEVDEWQKQDTSPADLPPRPRTG